LRWRPFRWCCWCAARPSWGNLALYGLAIGVGQFALLFYGMQRDITPGLASLVVQAQVFFTVGLAVLIDRSGCGPTSGWRR
jgi:drug/metabolite transporter (DMT)-like permease